MTAKTRCWNDAEIANLSASPDALKNMSLAKHLEECEDCCGRVLAVAKRSSDLERTRRMLRDWREGATNWPPQPGQSIKGRYVLLEQIAQGGESIVMKARDTTTQGTVALKFISLGAVGYDALAQARRAVKIESERVVRVLDVDDEYDPAFLVMQYVDGVSLRQRLQDKSLLPVKEILRIAIQLAEGVDAAHTAGVVHRDLKPENILLEGAGESLRVRIVDFGTARRFVDSRLDALNGGTVGYMAPEIVNLDDDGSPATDMFSLGCILYEMCARQPAFPAASFREYQMLMGGVWEHADVGKVSPDIPPTLKQLICALTAKSHRRRTCSAKMLLDALRIVEKPSRGGIFDRIVFVFVDDVEIPKFQGGWETLIGWCRPRQRLPLRIRIEPLDCPELSWQVYRDGRLVKGDSVLGYDFAKRGHFTVRLISHDKHVLFLPGQEMSVPIQEKIVPIPYHLRATIGLAFIVVALLGYWGAQKLIPLKGGIESYEQRDRDHLVFRGIVNKRIPDEQLVLAAETADGCWPKDAQLTFNDERHWTVTIEHDPLFGSELSFSLFSVTKEGMEKIRLWQRQGKAQGGHFRPLPKIEGGRRLGNIVVAWKQPMGSIEFIERDGSLIHVRGTANHLGQDDVLQLTIQTENGYWPKEPREGAAISVVNGRWTATIEHQPSNPAADRTTRVVLWRLSPAGHREITRWFERGIETQTYAPMTQPADATKLSEIFLDKAN